MPKSNVVPLGVNAQQMLKIVRETAANSENVFIPEPPTGGEWYRITNHRQVMLCLLEGELVGKPEQDDHGNPRCTLKRFSCGLCIWVTVSAY